MIIIFIQTSLIWQTLTHIALWLFCNDNDTFWCSEFEDLILSLWMLFWYGHANTLWWTLSLTSMLCSRGQTWSIKLNFHLCTLSISRSVDLFLLPPKLILFLGAYWSTDSNSFLFNMLLFEKSLNISVDDTQKWLWLVFLVLSISPAISNNTFGN